MLLENCRKKYVLILFVCMLILAACTKKDNIDGKDETNPPSVTEPVSTNPNPDPNPYQEILKMPFIEKQTESLVSIVNKQEKIGSYYEQCAMVTCHIVEDEQFYYYTSNLTALMRLNKLSKEVTKLYSGGNIGRLSAYQDRIYFSDFLIRKDKQSHPSLCSIKKDGTDFKVEIDQATGGMMLQGNTMYYTAGIATDNTHTNEDTIFSSWNLETNEKNSYVTMVPVEMLLEKDYLYTYTYDAFGLWKLNLQTKELINLLPGEIATNFQRVDDFLYFSRYNMKSGDDLILGIYKLNLFTDEITKVSDLNTDGYIIVDHYMIYSDGVRHGEDYALLIYRHDLKTNDKKLLFRTENNAPPIYYVNGNFFSFSPGGNFAFDIDGNKIDWPFVLK